MKLEIDHQIDGSREIAVYVKHEGYNSMLVCYAPIQNLKLFEAISKELEQRNELVQFMKDIEFDVKKGPLVDKCQPLLRALNKMITKAEEWDNYVRSL